MQEFNKEEYNKMCAEFLGWKYSQEFESYIEWDDFHGRWKKMNHGIFYTEQKSALAEYNYLVDGKTVYSSPLKFDSDWNWIIEVLQKISKTHVYKISNITCIIYMMSYERDNIEVTNIDNKEAVVQAIWQFLNWYKENK